ncbi:hypothetical protein ACFFOP_29435 [Sinosporangium siamense]
MALVLARHSRVSARSAEAMRPLPKCRTMSMPGPPERGSDG